MTNKKIGSISNYLAALVLLVMGMIYLLKGSFMPYHAEAVGREWAEVPQAFQLLILALMRAVAGGFLTAAVVIGLLQWQFSRNKVTWLPLVILLAGLVVGFMTLYATLIVRFNTPGNPPVGLLLAGMGLLVAGYIFNKRSLKVA